MGTMSKFRNYTLWFIGFFIISVILENALLLDMYKPMLGTASGNLMVIGSAPTQLGITVSDARATKLNGYLDIKIKNDSGNYIKNCSAKIDLFSAYGNLAATKYINISNFNANETRTFRVSFKGNEITNYAVTLIEEAPDRGFILDVFGYEVDLTDVLGVDFSKYVNIDDIKETGISLWGLAINFLQTVPTWAYIFAAGLIIWYMPSGYLFGIFP